MQWTDSDNLRGREALIVGGPHDGLRIVVNDSRKGLRYPDVFDMTGYRFDRHGWRFIYAQHIFPGRRDDDDPDAHYSAWV